MFARPIEWLSRLVKRQIDFAPDDVDYCEYECRKPQCLSSDWENCERRTRHADSCAAHRLTCAGGEERPSVS